MGIVVFDEARKISKKVWRRLLKRTKEKKPKVFSLADLEESLYKKGPTPRWLMYQGKLYPTRFCDKVIARIGALNMNKYLKYVLHGLAVVVLTVGVCFSINQILPVGWKLAPAVITGLAGLVLSLFFSLFPFFRVEFAGFPAQTKVWINLGLSALVAAVLFVFDCTNIIPLEELTCDKVGLTSLVIMLVSGMGANQLTYVATTNPTDVRLAKAERDEKLPTE